ncbi:hypothetical protein EIP91_002872 [Steccherinum ochraceum]|uniref:Uncharacterized protein n=1 Tax=Steccherinum ochraceum TaxID=92696 RepID=A0A4R0RRT4_9APHY|nr:hypothetical protein EIP91_002872 [Steccherinum ochraceum]
MASPLSNPIDRSFEHSKDNTFDDYLSIPSNHNQYDWYPTHDAPLTTSLANTLFHDELPHSTFLHSPLTSSGSSLSAPSPGRSDSDQDPSDGQLSPISDSFSEYDQDQGTWTIHDGLAYRQTSSSIHYMDDAPYMPPPVSDALHIQPATITTPLFDAPPIVENAGSGTRASRQKADANIAIIFNDSDVDAEGESDDCGSEDEYVPSPRLQPRDRRTFQYAYHSSRSESPLYASSSSIPRLQYPNFGSTAASPQDSLFRRTKPRHDQSDVPISVEHISSSSSRWRCPHPGCGYVQRNRRMPDFKRHTQTHNRFIEAEKWVCCGLPTHDAPLELVLTETATEFGDHQMVGGCWKVFSRRDALKRHLDNKNIPCKGNLNGSWMPGNSPKPSSD